MDGGIGSYNRFLQGEKSAFEELVVRYSDALTLFAYGFLKDFAAAEDVMMDVFAAMLVKRPRFRLESALKTYLFRAARNRAIDGLRARKRQTALDFACVFPAEEGAEGALLRDERRSRVADALSRLPIAYREVVYLVYFQELSVAETCVVLKKNPKQVYNALTRARGMLKSSLSEEEL